MFSQPRHSWWRKQQVYLLSDTSFSIIIITLECLVIILAAALEHPQYRKFKSKLHFLIKSRNRMFQQCLIAGTLSKHLLWLSTCHKPATDHTLRNTAVSDPISSTVTTKKLQKTERRNLALKKNLEDSANCYIHPFLDSSEKKLKIVCDNQKNANNYWIFYDIKEWLIFESMTQILQ